jgi:lambda repressor-like predicted transcriptional regulator
MSKQMLLDNAMALIHNSAASVLEASALQAATPIVLALNECDDELRTEAIELFKQLASGELSEEEVYATTALLAEILFPNADHKGLPGLDLVEAEAIARNISEEAKDVLDEMDKEESIFAENLRAAMAKQGLTQAQLAERIGVGQPAISNMLQRECRPQQRTVMKLAQALGVPPEELWPNLGKRSAR